MIQTQKISKTYGDKIILENVSITIADGDKVGLIAPNGTGKSTLIKIILARYFLQNIQINKSLMLENEQLSNA